MANAVHMHAKRALCMFTSSGFPMAIAWAHRVPFLISGSLSLSGAITHEIIFPLLGSYLFLIHYGVVYPMQHYFNVLNSDPYCPDDITWAFPNVEAFFVSSLVTFVILYALLWKHPQTWFRWGGLTVIFLIPPAILVWLNNNRLLHVALTIAVGILTTTGFTLWLFSFRETLPFVLNLPPVMYFGYVDTYLMTEDGQKRCRYIKECLLERQRLLESRGSSYRSFSILSSRFGATRSPSSTTPSSRSGTSSSRSYHTACRTGSRMSGSSPSTASPPSGGSSSRFRVSFDQ